MITKVYGTVDGADVIFDHMGGNRWQVAVPFDRDGMYIVELFAENERGNRSFYATALFIITATGTCTVLKMFPYRARLIPIQWSTKLTCRIYKLRLETDLYSLTFLPEYHIILA